MKKNYPNTTFLVAEKGSSMTFFRNTFETLSILTFFLLFANIASGQVANYGFTQTSGTHSVPAGLVNNSGNNWDDEVNAGAIGFTFNFNGTNYTTCNVSTNGFITFGATAPAVNNYTPISSNAGYAGAISALGRDLGHNGTRVRTTTTGSSPNRTFVVQWIDTRRWDGFTKVDNDFDFQIVLYETTNVVQIIYGPSATSYGTDLPVQVGLRGAANTDFNNRTTTNNWGGSTAGGANTSTCNTGTGAGELPTSGLTYTWTPRPTITSLTGSPACQGGNITINGTNLSNATAVTIGGTAVASITTNTATQIVAVIGTGTTGTVQVTTAGGVATSAGTFTVNSSPATIGGGAASVCMSATTPAFTNAVGGGTWSITNGTGSATISAGGVVTGVTAGTATVVYSIGTCSSTTPITINSTINTLATATAPANGATGVCYSGSGTTTQLSWGAAAGATGYDVYFGTTTTPSLVSSNQTATTWTISPVLAAGTTYYWRIVPRTACGATTGTTVNWNFTTNNTPCVCTPSSTSGTVYISGVSSEGTLTNGTNTPTTYSASGYGNYSAITIASQIPGGGINININLVGGQIIRTFVDWNKDGIFADPAEEVYTTGSTTLSGSTTFGFVVPTGQAAGNYAMRIRTRTSSPVDPCSTYTSGEAEDYTITVVSDCLQKITSVTNGSACGSPNTVSLSAVSAGATGFRWYSAETGGSLLADVAGSGNWTTPSIATTTTYYVTAYNGTCESLYRTPIKATILSTTNIIVTPSAPVVCGDNNPISITASGDTTEEDILVQDFESGMAPFTASIPTSTGAGADSPWSVKTSPYKPSATSVWKPAINSGSIATIGNKFALSSSDYGGSNIVSMITSPVINPSTYNSLTLTFDHYYSYFSGDSGVVQVSVNGGAFTAVTPTPAVYNSDLGTPSNFKTETVNLNAYAIPANTSLQFRFVYTAQFDDGWAIDNIKLSGIKPLNTTFTWSGGVDTFTDVACTIPYVAQSLSTIYVKPNATQINSASWAFSATATLSNGCSIVKNISVTNNTKTWTGASSQLWSDANNWSPNGVPTAANCVVIPNTTQITGSGYNALAKNLIIKSTGNLELQSSNNLTVTDEITVNASGVFNIRNNANLVQTSNVTNTGNVNAQRTANIRLQDYVYWSSPVANFPVSSVSPGTNASYIYKWLPTTSTAYASNFGTWSATGENMVTGKGYIVRGPNAYSPTVPANYTATFAGTPNNGTITTPISRSTYNGASYAGPTTTLVTPNDDNWNLIGNPYPSSIRAIDFLSANTNIAGFVNIWTHGTLPVSSVDPFYANYTYNYTVADYITFNASGASSGPSVFNGYIGSGQGFFVLMNHSSAATTETVTFNNTMRNATYSNGQFYRNSDSNSNSPEPEHNRIWLDIIKTTDNSNRRTLVGYIEGATNDKDRLYDAVGSEKLNFNIYSLLNNEMQLIQGRALPFDTNDTVDLGISIPQTAEYKIGIGALDGIFSNASQDILIEDKLLNITHNIKASPYTFTANQGRDNNRFVLKFINQTLSDDDNVYESDIKIFATNTLNIESSKLSINSISVYDIVGKQLIEMNEVQQKQITINQLKPTTNVLLVKVALENGTVVTKKVIY